MADALCTSCLTHSVRPEVKDTVRYTMELSFTEDAEKGLSYFVRAKHGTSIALPWPSGWVFTYWNSFDGRSRSFSSSSSSSGRSGYGFGLDDATHMLGPRLLKERYLCCDRFLVAIGVVHRCQEEPGRVGHPVLLIGEGGRVYVYDDCEDAVYLLSDRGFVSFYEDCGLRRFHRLREREAILAASVSTKPDNHIMRMLVEAMTLTDLVSVRDRLLGGEIMLDTDDWGPVSLTVCDLEYIGRDQRAVDRWAWQASACRIEVVLCARCWSKEGSVIHIPILCSDNGQVFTVDLDDGDRARIAADDLCTFFMIGLLRFRNNYRYYKGCFSIPGGPNIEDAGSAFAPTACSRTMYCRRKKKEHGNVIREYCRSLKRACSIRRKK